MIRLPQCSRFHRHQYGFGLVNQLLVLDIGFNVRFQNCLFTFSNCQKSATNGMNFGKREWVASIIQWCRFVCAGVKGEIYIYGIVLSSKTIQHIYYIRVKCYSSMVRNLNGCGMWWIHELRALTSPVSPFGCVATTSVCRQHFSSLSTDSAKLSSNWPNYCRVLGIRCSASWYESVVSSGVRFGHLRLVFAIYSANVRIAIDDTCNCQYFDTHLCRKSPVLIRCQCSWCRPFHRCRIRRLHPALYQIPKRIPLDPNRSICPFPSRTHSSRRICPSAR